MKCAPIHFFFILMLCAAFSGACGKHAQRAAPLPALRAPEIPTRAIAPAASQSAAPMNGPRVAPGNEQRREARVFRSGAKPRDTLDAADPVG
ncbi:MAG TPA: hypothetical protein VF294_05055, partial [Polyangiaceae bacterium]